MKLIWNGFSNWWWTVGYSLEERRQFHADERNHLAEAWYSLLLGLNGLF